MSSARPRVLKYSAAGDCELGDDVGGDEDEEDDGEGPEKPNAPGPAVTQSSLWS